MAKVKPKYRATLDRYLRWYHYLKTTVPQNDDELLYPFCFPIGRDPNAESPEIVMRDWESQGTKLPLKCSDPIQLYLYIEGKRGRDLWIHEWITEIELGTMFKQEFTEDLLMLGEDPTRVFQGVSNNYQLCYPKQWHTLAINNINPNEFFDNLEQTNKEWQIIHTVL